MRVDLPEIAKRRSREPCLAFGPCLPAVTFETVGGEVVAVEIRRRDLGTRVVTLEDEAMVRERSGFCQASMEDAQGHRVEATVDWQERKQRAGGEYREDREEDLAARVSDVMRQMEQILRCAPRSAPNRGWWERIPC